MAAVACSAVGVFLTLRKMVMLADAVTHTILLGIVLGYLFTRDLSSPVLTFTAAAAGLVTVLMTETLKKTQRLREDSAIGLVYPLLFSIAVILISRIGSVHLDADSVLLGELAFSPFDRLTVNGTDFGPRSAYVIGAALVLNLALLSLFFKELTISAFDPGLASLLGLSPAIVHYGLMAATSLTAVCVFDAVGSVLVVAFMAGPPLTARLMTSRLKALIALSCVIGAFNSVLGFQLALAFDVSISGVMAAVTGLTFAAVFLLKHILRSLRLAKLNNIK